MKKYVLVLLIAAAFLVAGCQEQSEGPDISATFIGGNQGLALSFVEGAPPNEILDDGQEEFSIGIMVENVGESNIGVETTNPFGFIEIVGINPTRFNKFSQDELLVTWDEADLTLSRAQRGFDGSIITGESSLVEIPGLSYTSDRTGNTEYTVRANVCYEYRSEAQGQICIKDNVLERAADDTICTLTGSKPLATSGAPMQVTQLTQNPAGADRIQITFRIENVGNGAVFAPVSGLGYAQDGGVCDPGAGPNTLRDQVNVEVSLGDEADTSYNIDCARLNGGDFGTIRMFGGAPIEISCTLETFGRDGNRIFTDNFNVDLHYTYLESIQKPLIVRDVSMGFD